MENKSERIDVRLTKTEKEEIKNKARKSKKSVSEFARQSLLKGEVRDYTHLLALITEVNRIGNNINQAVRILNQYNMADERDYNYLYDEFLKLKEAIEQGLLGEN